MKDSRIKLLLFVLALAASLYVRSVALAQEKPPEVAVKIYRSKAYKILKKTPNQDGCGKYLSLYRGMWIDVPFDMSKKKIHPEGTTNINLNLYVLMKQWCARTNGNEK